mmetsp:Transcript_80885/g.187815  ORF Transcript_80885/g.187815 Transcript_80885/m.187815 type:complete len:279 (-) Transcript_80885:346-1182(-)
MTSHCIILGVLLFLGCLGGQLPCRPCCHQVCSCLLSNRRNVFNDQWRVEPIRAAPDVTQVGASVVGDGLTLCLALNLRIGLQCRCVQPLAVNDGDVEMEANGLRIRGERPVPPEVSHVKEPHVVHAAGCAKPPARYVVPLCWAGKDTNATKLRAAVGAVGAVEHHVSVDANTRRAPLRAEEVGRQTELRLDERQRELFEHVVPWSQRGVEAHDHGVHGDLTFSCGPGPGSHFPHLFHGTCLQQGRLRLPEQGLGARILRRLGPADELGPSFGEFLLVG